MAAVRQSLLQRWFEPILDPEQVRRPLMVDPRLSEGIRKRKAKVEAANERLNNLANDGWAAGGADREHGLAVVEDDRRAHARQGSFTRSDGVGFGAEEAEGIGS